MRFSFSAGQRRLVALFGALALVALAMPAAAGPSTLKRSIENVTQGPLDIVLAPVIAGLTVYQNMRDIDDSLGVRIAYPVPGFIWNTMVQGGAGVIRGVTGILEIVPGVLLLPFGTDMDPLFDPADEQTGLVNFETPIYYINFGINYTTPD